MKNVILTVQMTHDDFLDMTAAKCEKFSNDFIHHMEMISGMAFTGNKIDPAKFSANIPNIKAALDELYKACDEIDSINKKVFAVAKDIETQQINMQKATQAHTVTFNGSCYETIINFDNYPVCRIEGQNKEAANLMCEVLHIVESGGVMDDVTLLEMLKSYGLNYTWLAPAFTPAHDDKMDIYAYDNSGCVSYADAVQKKGF